jgi:DNA helicase-2/ATP-dependent DNA helicase PcrA
MKIYKIIGPPGTGKTFRILSELEKAAKKYSPERIGAISFTTAAVNEMRDRIVNTQNHITKDILKNVRTLHSHCFRLLGLEKEQTAESHIDEFNKSYPNFAISTDDFRIDKAQIDMIKDEINNERFRNMQIFRNKRIPVEWWGTGVRAFWSKWSEWLEETGYIDYTKMLENTLLFGRYPDIDVLFVDEAQDLTRLQMEIILKWANSVDVTMLVGDADQAIFRFAGSEPEIFRDIKPTWFDTLKQSHRVPKKILDFSLQQIRKIKNREDVQYNPKEGEEGEICTSCLEPILSLPGTHMVITRCLYQIMQYIADFKRKKILWHNPYRPDESTFNPITTKEFQAVKTYWKLSRGQEVEDGEARDMTDHVIATDNIIRGKKKEIIEEKHTKNLVSMFDLTYWGFTDSFLRFDKPLEVIFKPKTGGGKVALDFAKADKIDQPPVIVGTIHSVKGGEADNVWVSLLRTRKISEEMNVSLEAREDEIRIAYVAFTRAKKFLGLLR